MDSHSRQKPKKLYSLSEAIAFVTNDNFASIPDTSSKNENTDSNVQESNVSTIEPNDLSSGYSNIFNLSKDSMERVYNEAEALVSNVNDILNLPNPIKSDERYRMPQKDISNCSVLVSDDCQPSSNDEDEVDVESDHMNDKDYVPLASSDMSFDGELEVSDDETYRRVISKRTRQDEDNANKKIKISNYVCDNKNIDDNNNNGNLHMVSGEEVANEIQVQQIVKSKSSKNREPVKSRYQLLPPCKCKFKCYTKISETERIEIHKRFWEIEKRDERISWMYGTFIQEEKRK